MRISDWSSDVCSSDLLTAKWLAPRLARYSQQAPDVRFTLVSADGGIDFTEANLDLAIFWTDGAGEHEGVQLSEAAMVTVAGPGSESDTRIRSEEHTSELQSLMRISYAVFCFKKKKQQKNKQ